ncbi:asparaginase domain-containing protein [Aureliella helgolandensis]|uniref:L-asparaginase 1 n=1 Tax=Aureliella helgolandensis TaxID=2527968 RepID=A0A518G2Z4_9BACT|nr:asparaginase domain-containing protein [Aureliella helgolandensis]QDV22964.1 L-asparaginase 1 [Aureliella helgolandensis]
MSRPAEEIHVQIFSCGGTIDKVYFDAKSEYEVGEPQIATIFRTANVTFAYSIESLFRKDSLEMQVEDRALIRQRIEACSGRYVLLTHGTDTMPETACALGGIPDKVIVLTGSMTPARFQVSDAEFNIGCAVGALWSQPPGVYIAMNGRVFSGLNVRKNREAGRFEELA